MTSHPRRPTRVLFVCLGNICRSPLAEGVARTLLAERGLDGRIEVDSAGTGAWHVGERPDARMRAVAAAHGVLLDGRARQVSTADLEDFDLVLAMDRDNLRDLRTMADDAGIRADVRLLRSFDPEGGEDVPDPYYGGAAGFDNVYRIVRRSCEALVDALTASGEAAP